MTGRSPPALDFRLFGDRARLDPVDRDRDRAAQAVGGKLEAGARAQFVGQSAFNQGETEAFLIGLGFRYLRSAAFRPTNGQQSVAFLAHPSDLDLAALDREC